MKSFFTEKQVRKFTLKEKFTYIFNQLNTLLNPITKKKSETIYCKYGRKIITYLTCLTYNEKDVALINNIDLPFDGIEIKTEKELIKITGEKFCYTFPPDMMPEIWRRLKRML